MKTKEEIKQAIYKLMFAQQTQTDEAGIAEYGAALQALMWAIDHPAGGAYSVLFPQIRLTETEQLAAEQTLSELGKQSVGSYIESLPGLPIFSDRA